MCSEWRARSGYLPGVPGLGAQRRCHAREPDEAPGTHRDGRLDVATRLALPIAEVEDRHEMETLPERTIGQGAFGHRVKRGEAEA